jgi:hypothetical protein
MHIMKNSWRTPFAAIDFCGWLQFADRWANEKHWYDHLVLYRNGLYPSVVCYADSVRRTIRKGKADLRRRFAQRDESSIAIGKKDEDPDL